MTTEEKINQLQAQIDELRKEVKPKFEVGKWYKFKSGIMNYQNGEYGYGVWNDNWHDMICFDGREKAERPATDKEVEEALIKEAERRGFKKGVRFKSAIRNWECLPSKNDFKYTHKHDYYGGCLLFLDGNGVFYNGKWAEIIKDEPVKVGGYEVKKSVRTYNIGCKNIWINEVLQIHAFMKNNNFKKVAFDGIEVDLDTIERILKL